MVLFIAVGARAETTNDLSDAEIQGRNLAKQLADAKPTGNLTNIGTLEIHNSKGESWKIPMKCEIIVTSTNWISNYIIGRDAYIYSSLQYFWDVTNFSSITTLNIVHRENSPNAYQYDYMTNPNRAHYSEDPGEQFGGTDFLVMDLGLEFFHWPQQKILKHEMRRSRACTVLESMNPNPSTNGYSRVISWIDNESSGIVQAQAYDSNNKRLKEFYPNVGKVNGQYQIKEMEMDNVQTDSRTLLKFDLKKD